MMEVGRNLRICLAQPLLKKVHPEKDAHDPDQVAFEYHQGGRETQP